MINAIAISTLGIGYGALSIATLGLLFAPLEKPLPLPFYGMTSGDWSLLRFPQPRKIEDDEAFLLAVLI